MGQYNNDINQGELANFNHYLDNHPKVAQRLAADPWLVDDLTFLANHRGLPGIPANPSGRAPLDARIARSVYVSRGTLRVVSRWWAGNRMFLPQT